MTTIDQDRRMLIELLRRDDDAPILGMDKLTATDRDFLTTTCAANIMLATICLVCRFDEADAVEGLAALELDKSLKRLLREAKP